jgi:hypothetical protein
MKLGHGKEHGMGLGTTLLITLLCDNFLHIEYSSLPLKCAPVYICIPVKYAFFGKKFMVQDLLVEHVMNRHLA